jgi:hypothetical protein
LATFRIGSIKGLEINAAAISTVMIRVFDGGVLVSDIWRPATEILLGRIADVGQLWTGTTLGWKPFGRHSQALTPLRCPVPNTRAF